MAALTFPITDHLRRQLEQVRAETERIAQSSFWSRYRQLHGMATSLSRLTVTVDAPISDVMEKGFSELKSSEDLLRITSHVDHLATNLRIILAGISRLDMLTRFAVRRQERKLAQQLGHIESISESLHLACDPEGTHLLALAAERVAKK